MALPTQLECFRHEQLDLTKHTFRIINVRGLSKDGLVDCTIRTHSREVADIGTAPPYNVLSYTWGPEQPCGLILLNGKHFRVRQNLLEFLETAVASHPQACRNIFVDALCINQEDILERNHQVMQMASIYRNATSVFVWLGLAEEFKPSAKLWNYTWFEVCRKFLGSSAEDNYQFDHDRSIGTTSWILDPLDIVFELKCSGPPSYIKKAIVLRKTDTGAFSYVAMAEYSSHYLFPRRCFLYHLPALQAAGPFHFELDFTSVRLAMPSAVFLVLLALYQMDMWTANPQISKDNLEFLGIKDGFIIAHSTVVDGWIGEAIQEEDCEEAYNGYAHNLERDGSHQGMTMRELDSLYEERRRARELRRANVSAK